MKKNSESYDRVYKSYDCTIDTLQETLDTFGVAVIPNIILENELVDIREKMFQELSHVTKNHDVPIIKEDPNTWRTLSTLRPLHGMLFQTYGLGHSQFAWDIRQHPAIANVFSKLWNVNKEDLITSFDGVSISLPPEITGFGWHTKDWYHCDQRFSNSKLHTIQGLVGCYDINEGDATLTVLEGSNKFHKDFALEFKMTKNNSDWTLLKEHQTAYYLSKGCQKTFVKASAGSLVLWDSRTIHAGSGPLKGRPNENTRLVVYTCQKPKIFATPNDLNKKQNAFNKKLMTNHDPCNVKLFDPLPRFYSKKQKDDSCHEKLNPVVDPVLTDLGKSLCGF